MADIFMRFPKLPKTLLVLAVVTAVAVTTYFLLPNAPGRAPVQEGERGFSQNGLETDTSRTAIPLEAVLSGGPGKDGIPAINEPKFTTLAEAKFAEGALGILVDLEGVRRFYPYAILVWHEIVNDKIGDVPFSVTFCPLCGTGIVFDRRLGGEELRFGVSGLLWESNLLMYDTGTESLWSQARHEAVVGAHVGKRLDILPIRLLTLGEVRATFPDVAVLSTDTGHRRDYDRNPYAGYEDAIRLLFPVSVTDKRFPAKEIMYVIPYEGRSYAFPQLQLAEGESFTIPTEDTQIVLTKVDSGVVARIGERELPGYYEMWFSWATHHQADGVALGSMSEAQ